MSLQIDVKVLYAHNTTTIQLLSILSYIVQPDQPTCHRRRGVWSNSTQRSDRRSRTLILLCVHLCYCCPFHCLFSLARSSPWPPFNNRPLLQSRSRCPPQQTAVPSFSSPSPASEQDGSGHTRRDADERMDSVTEACVSRTYTTLTVSLFSLSRVLCVQYLYQTGTIADVAKGEACQNSYAYICNSTVSLSPSASASRLPHLPAHMPPSAPYTVVRHRISTHQLVLLADVHVPPVCLSM